MNYANKLSVVFSSLVLSAVTTISFKRFSELFVQRQYKKRALLLTEYTSLLTIILLPITVGAIVLKSELVQVAFGRGAFDSAAVNHTANIFFFSALGIVFIAVREIMSKYFYSSGDTKTPMKNAAIGVGVNIVLNLILSKFMGAEGLALATTISNVTVCILLYILLLRRDKYFPVVLWFNNLLKIIVATGVMTVGIVIVNRFLNSDLYILKILIDIFSGGIIYLGALFFLDKSLLTNVLKLLVERL